MSHATFRYTNPMHSAHKATSIAYQLDITFFIAAGKPVAVSDVAFATLNTSAVLTVKQTPLSQYCSFLIHRQSRPLSLRSFTVVTTVLSAAAFTAGSCNLY